MSAMMNGMVYETIQSAIDSARPETTVTIAAGIYREALRIDKAITLVAVDGAQVTVAPEAGKALTISPKLDPADVCLRGLTIADGRRTGPAASEADKAEPVRMPAGAARKGSASLTRTPGHRRSAARRPLSARAATAGGR